jgi:hypothetical protein
MTVPTLQDLSELERVALGVIGAGLVPSSVAGDASFRLDVLTAVCLALSRGLGPNEFLESDGAATAGFQAELATAYDDLDAKRIIGVGGPQADAILRPGEPQIRQTKPAQPPNFDQGPTVFDRFLAGRCLDAILKHPDVYRFIMARYADSSEIWQRVYKQYV